MASYNYFTTCILVGTFFLPFIVGVDHTLLALMKGKDVSEASVRKIQRSGIFTDDQSFLRRTAYVETQFGDHSKTYRTGYFGGIWQVDENKFLLTKSASLSSFHSAITRKFNIDWSKVNWSDLRLETATLFSISFSSLQPISVKSVPTYSWHKTRSSSTLGWVLQTYWIISTICDLGH